MESLNDSRFRYVKRANGGPSAARNTGIDAAVGRYVAFLDSDDAFMPEKLSHFARLIGDKGGQAWYSPARVDRGSSKDWIRPDRSLMPGEDMGEYLFVHNQFIPTPTIVIDTQLVRSVRFDPDLMILEDPDLCIRLYAAGVRFQMTPEPLVIWQDTSDANRASRARGYAKPLAWLERSSGLMTERAAHGFKATQLAYFMAPDHPLKAIKLLAVGWWKGGVNLKIILRQFARSFMPASVYRQIVKAYISLFGSRRLKID